MEQTLVAESGNVPVSQASNTPADQFLHGKRNWNNLAAQRSRGRRWLRWKRSLKTFCSDLALFLCKYFFGELMSGNENKNNHFQHVLPGEVNELELLFVVMCEKTVLWLPSNAYYHAI
ncbi:hypothetical protein KIN20_025668 [Parelaphostrongylus tenuis]|uniref:Uncharacterized protein n=1 Tax=Parelaphostrongylus tenuis TaxID=148309 RepID=A0AAD5QXT5_PARTN|nr:hypothetical protein KIN20_025668 [Parelaphostrongylus tenuis]